MGKKLEEGVRTERRRVKLGIPLREISERMRCSPSTVLRAIQDTLTLGDRERLLQDINRAIDAVEAERAEVLAENNKAGEEVTP